MEKGPNSVSSDAELHDWLKDIKRGGRTVPNLVLLSDVTDVGLEALAQNCQLKQVKTLYVKVSQATAAGVQAFVRSRYLTNLKGLHLISERVTDSCLMTLTHDACLSKLQELCLISNRVTDSGVTVLSESQLLSQLRRLYLNSNQVTDGGIAALVRSRYLLQLSRLDLGNTRLTDRGMDAVVQSQNLAILRYLNIDRTQITDAALKALSESSCLTKLVSLNLQNTQVTDAGLAALVQSSCLPSLRRIGLSNTKVTLPKQIIRSYNAPAIFRYFRESRLGGPLLEVKVPILGMGALGKSLLLRHLSGDKGAFQQNAPSTHAFEVRTISLPVVHTEQDHQCSIRLFDFGGQRELHGAHRFFLADKRNVYVIVVSARLTREENHLDYWLRMVKHCGGNAPVVVVVTHCDAEKGAIRTHSRDRILPPPNADELSSKHELFVQVVDNYSNVNGANIDQVRAALQRAIATLDLVFDSFFAPGFFTLRNWLLGDQSLAEQNLPAFKRYWTVDNDFRQACMSVGQTNREQQDLWLILLRDLGHVHFVGDRPKVKRSPENSLSNYLFHPEWVKKPVYNVVRLEARQGGIVSGKQVNAELQLGDMSDEEIRRLLALMLECALIFQVRGGDPDTPDYLIPDQISVRPEGISLDWIKEPKRKYRWHFHFLPDNLLAQLVGQWFDYQPKAFTYYRDDVVLTMPDVNCRVRLQANFNNHELVVEFDKDRIELLKTRLEIELKNLLDPEHALRKPPWEEDDLLKPETIVPQLIERIAESLWKLVMSKNPKPDDLKNVGLAVKDFFEESNQKKKTLTSTEKLTYRLCMLFAFAHSGLVLKDTEAPRPWKEHAKDVLDWLNSDGVEIKNCFRDERGFKTLDKPESFSRTYNRAYHKLGKSGASREDLERNADLPDNRLKDD